MKQLRPLLYTKDEVKFEHPAKGMDNCRDCAHFIAKDHLCKIVEGTIQPGDWCDKFKKVR